MKDILSVRVSIQTKPLNFSTNLFSVATFGQSLSTKSRGAVASWLVPWSLDRAGPRKENRQLPFTLVHNLLPNSGWQQHNKRFATDGQIIQNPQCRRTSYALGHKKKSYMV